MAGPSCAHIGVAAVATFFVRLMYMWYMGSSGAESIEAASLDHQYDLNVDAFIAANTGAVTVYEWSTIIFGVRVSNAAVDGWPVLVLVCVIVCMECRACKNNPHKADLNI